MQFLLMMIAFYKASAINADMNDNILFEIERSILRPIDQPFVFEIKLTNNLSRDLNDVAFQFLKSNRIKVTYFKIEQKVYTINDQESYEYQLVPQLAGKAVLLLIGEAIIASDYVTSGYHVESVLFNFIWFDNGIKKYSGHKMADFHYFKTGCDTLFDVANNELRADQVTASTFYDNSPPEKFGPNSEGWCAKDQDNEQYIEILFTRKARIVSLSAGPRTVKRKDQITQFYVMFLNNGEWRYYEENEARKKFQYGAGLINKTLNWFINPIEGDGIRVQPIDWISPIICARLTVMGCYVSNEDNCINPIGMKNGLIPKYSISDDTGNVINANNARLDGNVTEKPYGWQGKWLQIDLSSLFKVTRIGIQSGYGEKGVVTKFKILQSNNTVDWHTVKDPRTKSEVFENLGREDSKIRKVVSIKTLAGILSARSFRIEVVEFVGINSLRMELYGCHIHARKGLSLSNSSNKRSALVDSILGIVHICHYDHQERSTCYTSEEKDNFNKWFGQAPEIDRIIGIDHSNKTYARTKRNGYAVKLHNYKDWKVISQLELRSQTMRSTGVLIPTIVESTPSENLQWTIKGNSKLAVSGYGLHIKVHGDSKWKRIASWTCCGL